MTTLLHHRVGKAAVISLNRPAALNALNAEMCQELASLIRNWHNPVMVDCPRVVIMKGVGGKAFCAGGDVKSIYLQTKDQRKDPIAMAKQGSIASQFFKAEYEMNYLLASSRISQVSLWDGIVMGGGAGISIHGKYRVATEKTVFAMPETMIGLFPDVGFSNILPRIKNGLGNYIGLTGCRLGAADLMHTGLATHFIPSSALPALEQALIEAVASDTVDTSYEQTSARVGDVLAQFSAQSSEAPDLSKAALIPNEDSIRQCFGAPTCSGSSSSSVENILEALSSLQQGEGGESSSIWAKDTISLLRSLSPTSLKICLEQLSRAEKDQLSLDDCLKMEFRLMMRCLSHRDFAEGIRAVLVDKDQKPNWTPKDVESVNMDDVYSFFKPLWDEEGNYDLQLLPLKR